MDYISIYINSLYMEEDSNFMYIIKYNIYIMLCIIFDAYIHLHILLNCINQKIILTF